MSISVPADFAAFVEELVAGGAYVSAEEVVRDALAQMRDRHSRFASLKATFDEAIAELDRGEGILLDFEEIKRKGRERLAAYRRK